ncbi:MAG TPA: ABC transporter permease, partial [Gemmatimonadaceae bacterium]|nr:ABC transporter permease [Gemmatimonadaceae bacterium]
MRPVLGRTLLEADEQPGAPAVAVIGYDVWTTRFARDRAVIGRTVRLGRTETVVVGVMPQGFAFPVAQNVWIPLRLRALDHARREGPAINVFGRLAPGVTLADAQAELSTGGRVAAAEFPHTHGQLRPRVMPYARSILDVSGWASLAVMSINVPLLMLIVLICGNVALLMFARAATRESEIAVRSALGASRRRIIMQLFAEALVLGGVAAVVGLAAAGFGMRWVMGVAAALEGMQSRAKLPFWFDDRLSPITMLYAVLLTVLGAVIAGVVPGLKVTRGLGARLKQVTAGGGGLRFGGVWTAVIIAQVAVTVAFPAVAYFVRRDAVQIRSVTVGFPAEEYLSVRLEMDRESSGGSFDTSAAAFQARFTSAYRELERRLATEPAVTGITYADRFPRMYHPHRLIEVDDGGAAPLVPPWPAYRVSSASVDPEFFDAVGVPILAGRKFASRDHESDARVVIVNQSFVERVLGGRNPIGRRLRYVHFEEWSNSRPLEPGPWHEIIGVVRDMGMAVGADVGTEAGTDPKVAGFYHPVAPGGAYPAHMALHVRGEPRSFAPRLRELAAATDPTLRLYDIMPLDLVNQPELAFLSLWFRLLLLVSGIALILSLAGIYSVMAFTVARRTREIGIRVALGANSRRVIAVIFRRPLIQVALGVVGGALIVTLFSYGVMRSGLWPKGVMIVLGYSTLMMLVCL